MNKVVHFDVPVNDPERAKEFYQKAFGWQIEETPGMPYWMITTAECGGDRIPKEPGAINGGFPVNSSRIRGATSLMYKYLLMYPSAGFLIYYLS